MENMQEIRNIAIIAHVDHGKTTLVDRMIYQANLVRQPENLGQLILDNNDLERERGITILAKNVSVIYKGVKINIIDTPGHSDFGGEVERVLNMADGVLLLVDAFEGCMPQTRFVLQKAIQMGKKPIVVINKVDKPNCRPDEVQEEVFDLMFNLDATEEQQDFVTVYGSAKQGWMSLDWKQPTSDITPLLDTILDVIPAPPVVEGTPQLLISSLEYSPYVGRIAVGRITRGTLRSGQQISLCKRYDIVQKQKIKQLMVFEGLGKTNVEEVQCGDICAVVGIEGFEIGDTIADYENPEALAPIAVDEPTMSMLFTINNSPFFGNLTLAEALEVHELLHLALLHYVVALAQGDLLPAPEAAAGDFAHCDTAHVWGVFERGDEHLRSAFHNLRCRNLGEYGIQQIGDVAGGVLPVGTHPALLGAAEHGLEVELLLGGAQVEHEVEHLFLNFLGAAAGLVHLIHHHYGLLAHSQGLLQHETRLGHAALERIYQQQHAVGHVEHALHFAAEIAVARSVDDVDFDSLVCDGDVLCENSDASFALQVVAVQDELAQILGLAHQVGLINHAVDHSSLTMVDVRDESYVADIHTSNFSGAKLQKNNCFFEEKRGWRLIS